MGSWANRAPRNHAKLRDVRMPAGQISKSAKFGSISVDVCRNLPNLGRMRAMLRRIQQKWLKVAPIFSNFGQVWPISAKHEASGVVVAATSRVPVCSFLFPPLCA